MSLLGFASAHLASAAGLALVAVALGRRIAAFGGAGLRDGRLGLPLALGLGAIACGASLIAAAGALTLPAILLLLAAAAAVAAPEWRRLAGEARALALGPRRPWAALAVLGGALPAALLALYPPTGFDAVLYRLPAAVRIAASGRIGVAPELRFPAFPCLDEVLFAAALRVQDDVLCQCVEWVAYAGTAALLWEGCSRRYGRWAGALAAALWLGDPLAAWLAASAYVEPLVAFFTLAAVEALAAAGSARAPRALLLAGGLAGCAAATKYQGLLAVVLVAAGGLFGAAAAPTPAGGGGGRDGGGRNGGGRDGDGRNDSGRDSGGRDGGGRDDGGGTMRRRLATAAPALLAAGLVALPWYLWIGAATGDPLFPLLSRLRHPAAAGSLGMGPGTASVPVASTGALPNTGAVPRAVPVPRTGWAMWAAVVHSPHGAAWRALWPYPPGSPLLWLLWPLPLLAWRRLPAAGRMAAAGLAMALVVAAVNPDPRLVSVAAPLLAAAIAAVVASWAAARWGEAAAAPRLAALALAALLPAWLYTAHLVARRGPVPAGAADREAYLRQQLPGYTALSWLNASFGGRYTVYALAAENLRYYAAGRFLGDWYGPAPFGEALRVAARPRELYAMLAPLGVDHLLVRRTVEDPDLDGADPLLARWVAGDPDPAGTWFRAEYRDAEAAVWALAPAAGGAAAGGKGTPASTLRGERDVQPGRALLSRQWPATTAAKERT